MSKSSGSAPAPVDQAKVAALQGAENRKTLQYSLDNSRTSTVNPFGSTSWKNNKTFDQAGFDAAMKGYQTKAPIAGNPGAWGDNYDEGGNVIPAATPGPAPNRADFEGKDNWTNTQALSPESQGIYDAATGKLNQAVGNISTNADAYNQAAADAVYNRMRRYQDPADAIARSSQQADMADRGFSVGNDAYSTERNRLDNSQSMGRADAADRAQATGFQQGQAQLTQQQQIAQALSGIRNQQVAGVAGMPTTTTTPSIQPYDIAGATQRSYEDQLNSYNAQTSSDNALMGSIIGAGGAMMGMPGAGGIGSLIGMMGNQTTPQANYSSGINPQPVSIGNMADFYSARRA